ncbi:2-succinyl-5-enolpyruvyl-6-hydroxy-3-cyclohexene-1-carboxylate synthase [Metabacillus crassostreae]|uniref:2-succinyl-5-enolpyruvyl-6-hydroxy-3- cyclohexene-1-carboxylic-acid synthase n=1 Tax=Metabacillus crassostreae TaxID=929098 RepID=UPI00195BB05B|nr:2-succinyl-5-enolpyruvyl-6-hydroxy-3-cyclohexene-1-carboxylic-acid synthase [Metabacillus crassostreae]MBM7606052.1 2-succinyl-5-enolpyruvyl-6-hydroxy-3-cyclohexene-1-carboxylate synthase [Metabacillus crassostreae]
MSDNSLTRYVASFVDELSRAGVEQIVISPGSRSTPLAMLFLEHPDVTTYINIDERSAGFFALGLAKSGNKPVALVCTSGTAAANYYPAIIEAHYSRVPLLILTADRPHELRDVGAPQAIDQINMYGKYSKWFVDLALAEENDDMLRYSRTIANRSVGISTANPQGVVHLNFPFREPLIPNLMLPNLWDTHENRKTYLHTSVGVSSMRIKDISTIIEHIEFEQNGIIICGDNQTISYIDEVIKLSDHLKYPILADPLSQIRAGKHRKTGVIDCYDTILKDPDITKHVKPNVVIRFGAMPVSKPLMKLLKNNPGIIQIVVDPSGEYRDPTLNSSHLITCNEDEFCKEMIKSISRREITAYYKKWIFSQLTHDQEIEEALTKMTDLFEGKVVQALQKSLPQQCKLVVGNSMPIRDVDTFFRNTSKEIEVYCNRGANGIDGVVSTALGICAKESEPTFLLIGDLSFYHDLNGLLAAKMNKLNLTVILINNDGGGIFSFLPQSSEEKHFERLYGTPTGLEYAKVVEMYGGEFNRINSWEGFQSYFDSTWANEGLKVLEIQTNRNTRVKVHRELLDHVSQEIRKVLNDEN